MLVLGLMLGFMLGPLSIPVVILLWLFSRR
jgi:hypothetical protein